MENRKLNIILGIVSAVLLLTSFYMVHLTIKNEDARIYFNIKDIENINWIDEEENISFKLADGKVNFKINGDNVIRNEDYTFNNQTGEIVYNDISNSLYIRTVNEESIVVWYEKAEYHLDQEFIAK